MKSNRLIRLAICLIAAMLLFIPVCPAEEAFHIEDAGLDMTETLSVHYPVLSGPGDEALLEQINTMIREDCHIGDYLARTAQLIAGGSLQVSWQGGIMGDVFSCAVSAVGAVENSRSKHVWNACTADLRDGRRITLSELFTDEEAGREQIRTYLEDEVLPELSPHLQNSELEPLPETFLLEPSGLTLLYPVSQLSTLGDRAGDIRIGWHVLKDVLNLAEDSIPDRIGVKQMITLTAESAEQLLAASAEGSLTGIPVKLGDSVQEMTDRYHLLTDPDGFEDGRLFALEGGCFRGVYLMTDDLTRGWENSKVEGIRMDQGCLWGLCVNETMREDWISVLGEPDGSAAIDEEKAEANRLVPGTCDYYSCGEYQLRLYSDDTGCLICIVLTA